MGERWGWFSDFRWAMNAMRARRYRRRLLFAERQRFDSILRPILGEQGDKSIIAYPDAIYHMRPCDLQRAISFVPTP